MDENKELLTGEPETDAADGTETDNAAAEADDSAVLPEAAEADDAAALPEAAEADDAAALPEAAEADEPSPAPKKKRTLQTTILISLVIVACVLLAAVVCRLFFMKGVTNTNIIGGTTAATWHYRPDTSQLAATVDEAAVPDYYFTFFPDDTVKVNIGSFEFQGSYMLRNIAANEVTESGTVKEGTPVLEISGTSQIDGTFAYERSGNVFTGSTLKLTSVADEAATVTLDAKDYVPVTVERTGEFTKDDALTGNWIYKNEMVSQSFCFNEDGTYLLKTMAQGVIEKQTGIYNTKNGTLTITYKYPNSEQTQTLKYSVKDDKLSLVQIIEYNGQTMEQPLNDFTREK